MMPVVGRPVPRKVVIVIWTALLVSCGPARMTSTPAGQPPGATGPAREPAAAPPATGHAGDFESRVRPLLEARCQPCHFPGGSMYGKLPFDQEETIRELGERLFTRIKDPGEQEIIRGFLAR